MKMIRVALIGFGNVGQGFAKILRDFGNYYKKNFNLDIRIVAVTDPKFGGLYHPKGLNLKDLLALINNNDPFSSYACPIENGWDAQKTIAQSNSDVIVEVSYTNLATAEPATGHIRQALETGKHVVTSNKGPIALNFIDLNKLAQENNVQIGLEGTVMSGTPGLHLGAKLLKGAGILAIKGILNGTTNYILTEMEKGRSYVEALKNAQLLGYAEADPAGDVEGFDSVAKVAILSTLLFNTPLKLDQIDRNGIVDLESRHIRQALKKGNRWKLVGSLDRYNGAIQASVKPVCLPIAHPLASVCGVTNAIRGFLHIPSKRFNPDPRKCRLTFGLASELPIRDR